jgi:hypothetical protein
LLALLAFEGTAFAQAGGGFTWNPGTGGTTWGTSTTQMGPPQPSQTTAPSGQSTDLEIGSLYVTAAAYGAGTGVWIDAEAGISDPGFKFIAPAVLGVAGPVGVYFLDHPAMPRGIPASISAGLTIGAGEGLGIWSYQFTHATEDNAWGFKELARSVFVGSTIGGVGGAVLGYTQQPSPKTSLLLGSSVVWGAGIGSMFGYGSATGDGYGDNNDSASLGGLIGYNVGLAAAAGVSSVWVPTYKQLAWMWMGAGAGFAATLPVYLFYIGSDHDARHGLIVQGVGTTLGIVAGAAFTWNDKQDIALDENPAHTRVMITGVGMMPVKGGGGAQLSGIIF